MRLCYSKFMVNFEKIMKTSLNLLFLSLNDFRYSRRPRERAVSTWELVTPNKTGRTANQHQKQGEISRTRKVFSIFDIAFVNLPLLEHSSWLVEVQLITRTDPEAV